MKRLLLASSFIVLVAVALAQTPVEKCGTDVPKTERELRARICPEGYVGQWFQERAANTCDWKPLEPQWYACSRIIYPVEENPVIVAP